MGKGHDTLCSLSMNNNKLQNLEGFEGLRALETLNLNSNELTTLAGLKGAKCLKVLNLNRCFLKSLRNMPEGLKIKELWLDVN